MAGVYLHIPKTGGTALGNAFLVSRKLRPFDVAGHHGMNIINVKGQVFFSIRDPLDRFCSGYWERYTNPMRRIKNKTAPAMFKGSGYKPFNNVEKYVFNLYPTPNDLLTALRKKSYPQSRYALSDTDLNLLLAPIIAWIGDVKILKEHEDRIGAVFNLSNLTTIMKSNYGIEMPKDPFLKRSRDQFPTLDQSYEVSEENTKWFMSHFRKADYEVVDYIKQQSYYIDS